MGQLVIGLMMVVTYAFAAQIGLALTVHKVSKHYMYVLCLVVIFTLYVVYHVYLVLYECKNILIARLLFLLFKHW